MKVKVGNEVHDANEEPIMLIFEDQETLDNVKDHLSNMVPGAKKYCMYPDNMNHEEVRKFMQL